MAKKKVMIFIDWFLPGDRAGGPVRSCVNMIAALREEYEFCVVTRNTDYTMSVPYKNIRSDCWEKLPDGTSVYYFSESKLGKDAMQKLVEEISPDFIYVNGMWSKCFTQWPLKIARGKKIKHVVSVRGMLAPDALALKSFKKRTFLRVAKLTSLYGNAVFHVTNEKEQKETQAYFRSNRIVVAPNIGRKMDLLKVDPEPKRVGEVHLVTIARYAPEKNVQYAIDCLQHCRSNVKLDMYGSIYDNEYYAACERSVSALPPNVKVALHDAVPSSSVHELLGRSHALFLPSRGENFGHVILESMQSRTPVLISDRTPWRGLADKKAGWDLSLDSPAEFAGLIDRIAAMSQSELEEWRKGATAAAAAFLSSDVSEKYREIFS